MFQIQNSSNNVHTILNVCLPVIYIESLSEQPFNELANPDLLVNYSIKHTQTNLDVSVNQLAAVLMYMTLKTKHELLRSS